MSSSCRVSVSGQFLPGLIVITLKTGKNLKKGSKRWILVSLMVGSTNRRHLLSLSFPWVGRALKNSFHIKTYVYLEVAHFPSPHKCLDILVNLTRYRSFEMPRCKGNKNIYSWILCFMFSLKLIVTST